MRQLVYKPFFFLLIGTVCMATQCDKYVDPGYNFSEKIDLFPEKAVYQIGDTIWISHNNPLNTLYDSHTSQSFLTDTLNIAFSIPMNSVYNLPDDKSNTFCDFIFKGVNEGSYFTHTFGCSGGGSFNFRVGMVLNKKGTFSINLNYFAAVTSCNTPNPYMGVGFPYSYINYRFTVSDGHKDIFLGVTPARRADDKQSIYNEIKDKSIYFLKVQ